MKPIKNRIFCRECNRMKMLFKEEKDALNFIKYNSSNFEDKIPIRAYYCDACFGWHITSRIGVSYKNPLTDNVFNAYADIRNSANKLSGFYSAEITTCFNNLKTSCGMCRNKKIKASDKRLILISEYREKLRSYLSSKDFEVVERIIEKDVQNKENLK